MSAALCAAYSRRMQRSMKMMWGCVAIAALGGLLAVASANAGFLLFALPCMLIMDVMMWMMMGGMGGGSK